MDRRGLLSDFFICKIWVALAVVSLMGTALVMLSSFKRSAEEERLATVVDAVANTIQAATKLPGKVELERRLPTLAEELEVKILGTREDVQVVRIIAGTTKQVERTLILESEVNNGRFLIEHRNPNFVRVRKTNKIELELV